MTSPSPDPQEMRQWRREQRRIARAHHPDLGADPAEYVRLMRELDLRYGFVSNLSGGNEPGAAGTAAPVTISVSSPTGLRRAFRRYRQAARSLRARLPRQVPGARRYIDL